MIDQYPYKESITDYESLRKCLHEALSLIKSTTKENFVDLTSSTLNLRLIEELIKEQITDENIGDTTR